MGSAIKKVTLCKCYAPLVESGVYTTGYKDPEQYPIIITEISNGEVSGFGEFVPTSILYEKGHIGRSGIDEWQVLQEAAEDLLGKDCRILGNWLPENLKSKDANSLVDSIDFAIHDLAGRIYNLPVPVLIGGFNKRKIKNMFVIHTFEPDYMIEKTKCVHEQYGYRYFKLKPHADFEKDNYVITKIKEEIEGESHIYIDPNFALDMEPDGVIDYLNKLHKVGLELCEDPFDRSWEDFHYVKERTPVKIMADCNARTISDVVDIAAAAAAVVVNIHANWAGGFKPALNKAMVAANYGIETMVGSTFYTGVGVAAYKILSAALPGDMPCEQESAEECTTEYIVKKEFDVVDGCTLIPDSPGLGVEVDPEKLAAITREKVVIE